MRGRRRCRLHGGLNPGAPRGARNGNFTDGTWSAEAIEERRWLRSLVRSFGKPENTPWTANGDIPNGAVASIARRPPVRVKLRRINADLAKAYPSDGETRAWWDRLERALGTSSSAFVNSSLVQLQAAARLPFGGISETAVNAALAMIEAAAPKDEIEGALAVQMACTHTAAMAVLARLGGGHGSELRVAALSGSVIERDQRLDFVPIVPQHANNSAPASVCAMLRIVRATLSRS